MWLLMSLVVVSCPVVVNSGANRFSSNISIIVLVVRSRYSVSLGCYFCNIIVNSVLYSSILMVTVSTRFVSIG